MRCLWTAFLCVLFILSSSLSVVSCVSYCVNPPSATSPPVDPPGVSQSLPATPAGFKLNAGCSERLTNVYTQGEYNPAAHAAWPRLNCPHLSPGLVSLDSTTLLTVDTVTNTGSLVIPTGSRILLRPCSFPGFPFEFTLIHVQSGASLVFDDAPINLRAREIFVDSGGELLIGSESCRLYSSINITFTGRKSASSMTDTFGSGLPSKGLLSRGRVEMHGRRFHPTWTRLARSATAGSAWIYLQESVNWPVGGQILITTSIFYDCPSQWSDYCRPCWTLPCGSAPIGHQNEIRRILAVERDPDDPWAGRGTLLLLDSPLQFLHYGGAEYQSEVVLLSRSIMLAGADYGDGDGFGGHTKIIGPDASGRFSGVSALNMGQLNVLGRYPFHFHMMGNSTNTYTSYFQENVVLNSNFRAYVVHGTNGTRISRNIAYNIQGMAYYLEDGVEENNIFEYNVAAHIHPIYRPARGDFGQQGEYFESSVDLVVPADTSASGFYALNAYNRWIGNAASGGWSGYAFPNAPQPMGNFQGSLNTNSPWAPLKRPLLEFRGNTAHSNGFYWLAHSPCLYVGGWLDYKPDNSGAMLYQSGRSHPNTGQQSRSTQYPNGTREWMRFIDLKVWMCNKGVSHWGDSVEIINAEFMDVKTAVMGFGSASIQNALITGNSNNPARISQWWIYQSKMGFQFYDTFVQTILSQVTFRNFSITNNDRAIRYMDHSDQFTNQGINAVGGLEFENVHRNITLGISNCGAPCGDNYVTMSTKIYSVWDTSGSFTGSGEPTIMGGALDFWNQDNNLCRFNPTMKIWSCKWINHTTVVQSGLVITGLTDGCDSAVSTTCGSQKSTYMVGTISQWGPNGATRKYDTPPWIGTVCSGIVGLARTGLHFRARASVYGIDGAPNRWLLGSTYQIPRGQYYVLSMAYPTNSQFRVSVKPPSWYSGFAYPSIPMAPSLDYVLQPNEDLPPSSQFRCPSSDWRSYCDITRTPGANATGPAWYFDSSSGLLYVRMVPLHCYARNEKDRCFAGSAYKAGGLQVPSVDSNWAISIVANCTGCTIQSSRQGVDYYDVTDVRPPQIYRGWEHPNAKPIALMPMPTLPPKPAAWQLCRDRALNPSFAGVPPGTETTDASASSSEFPINVSSPMGYGIIGGIAVAIIFLAFAGWRFWSRRSSWPTQPKSSYSPRHPDRDRESINLQVNPATSYGPSSQWR